MNVRLHSLNTSREVEVALDRDDSVHYLRLAIAYRARANVGRVRVFANCGELPGRCKLGDCGVQSGGVIFVAEVIRMYVCTPGCASVLEVEVLQSSMVDVARRLIARAMGAPLDDVRLFARGVELHDGIRIRDYGLLHACNISATVTL